MIDSGPTLIGEIWTHKPGDKVKITYERDGKTHTVDADPGLPHGRQLTPHTRATRYSCPRAVHWRRGEGCPSGLRERS